MEVNGEKKDSMEINQSVHIRPMHPYHNWKPKFTINKHLKAQFTTTSSQALNHLKTQLKRAKFIPRNSQLKGKCWVKRFFSIPIMSPYDRSVQIWNKVFTVSCLMGAFVDPMCFLVLKAIKERRCILMDWHTAIIFAAVRSIIDLVYFIHILLQFRLAYVASGSTVVGAGDLVHQPKRIAKHYLHGCFIFDLIAVVPVTQVRL